MEFENLPRSDNWNLSNGVWPNTASFREDSAPACRPPPVWSGQRRPVAVPSETTEADLYVVDLNPETRVGTAVVKDTGHATAVASGRGRTDREELGPAVELSASSRMEGTEWKFTSLSS